MSSSTTGSKAWMPGSRGVAAEPVGGGQDPGGVGGSVAGGQPQLDGLAGGVEADEVHPGRRAGPDRDDLEVGRRRRGAGARPTIRRASSGAVPDGRSRLRAAVPLEEVRIERRRAGRTARPPPRPAARTATTPRLKFGAATAAAPCSAQERLDASADPPSQPVVAMTNRRQPASSAAATFGGDGVAARRLDDDLGAGAGRRVVPPGRRAGPRTRGVVAALPRRAPRPPARAARRRG